MSDLRVNPRYHLMHAVGFHNADVSWLWILFSVVGFVGSRLSAKPWKILTTKLCPSSLDELVWDCMLIYAFRNVERKFGSKKYANFLLIVVIISGCLELTVIRIWKSFQHLPFNEVVSGLYSPLCSCFVAYMATSPAAVNGNEVFQRCAFACYAFLVLLRTSYHAAMFSTLCGATAGLLYISDVLKIQRWTLLPGWLVQIASKLKIPNLVSNEVAPDLMVPMGATESAQTEQLYEWWESFRFSRDVMAQQSQDGENYVQPPVASGSLFRRIFWPGRRTEAYFSEADEARITEERVQALMSMGFSDRQQIVDVLRSVNNDQRLNYYSTWPYVCASSKFCCPQMPASSVTQCSKDGQNLTSTEDFDLRKVCKLFRDCYEQDDRIHLPAYILAFQELNKFFLLLGRIFSFVSTEIMDKTRILSEHLTSELGHHYANVQSMLHYEVDAGVVHSWICSRPSGSMTLLRLHRALQFVASFIDSIRLSKSDQIAPIARKAYDETLARYHGWIVRKAVHLAVYTLPTRKQLMSHLSERLSEAETEQIMREVVVECTAVFERVDQLYVAKQLHNIP
ncbi:hypothetical protein M513_07708 [Trichuris suis]|uniref:UBA domain-containing protein n=1 Tax=Trichuris suis TaxID=68888 RepID=A0A085M2P9_9BILA|nr:hypothetical protein M513_07708 [Trichuris suis]